MEKHSIVCLVMAVCIGLLSGCGRKEVSDDNLYGDIIAKLEDDEQFSLVEMGEQNRVLLTTDLTYDDGSGHNAALYCDVYYAANEKVYSLGKIESMGTAYPVRSGKECIYTASGHSLEVYRFDNKNQKWITSKYDEILDAEGNAAYQYTDDGRTETITEEDFLKAMEEYGSAMVVNFGYGASDNPL